MNATNDPDIAAVAETLQLAQDAILSDSKQLAGQFVARLYEVTDINRGLMVSALDSGASAPGSSPGLGHCVVFLGKTLYSHGASLHPGV